MSDEITLRPQAAELRLAPPAVDYTPAGKSPAAHVGLMESAEKCAGQAMDALRQHAAHVASLPPVLQRTAKLALKQMLHEAGVT